MPSFPLRPYQSSKREGDHHRLHRSGSGPARPFLGQFTKDLRLLLGDNLQANLASFDSLLEENK